MTGSGNQIANKQASWREGFYPWVILLCRLLVGSVLLYAGWGKLFDMETFMTDIGNYRIIPDSLLPLTAIVLPAIEIVVGSCLLLGLFMDGALAISTALIVFFLLAIESAILRGLDIKCGCFGTTDAEMVGIGVLVRDFLLLLCVIPLWIEKYRVLAVDSLCCRAVKHPGES